VDCRSRRRILPNDGFGFEGLGGLSQLADTAVRSPGQQEEAEGMTRRCRVGLIDRVDDHSSHVFANASSSVLRIDLRPGA
jgi:hypothetical protein